MKLADIIAAGGYCAWSGEQRRPLVPLGPETRQGGGVAAPAADVAARVTKGRGGAADRGLLGDPRGGAGLLTFGRKAAR